MKKKKKRYSISNNKNKKVLSIKSNTLNLSKKKKNHMKFNNIIKTNDDFENSGSNSKIKIKNTDNMISSDNKNIDFLEINKKKINNNNEIMKLNYYELNNLTYKEALKLDKRSYLEYYFSLLKIKQLLIFTFYTNSDYNSRIIKIILFFFSFALYFTINALFFNDSTMHKIYVDRGNYNFLYQIPQILYSTIISSLITIIVQFLSLTEKNILTLKKEKKDINEKASKILKCLTIKFFLFFILCFIFLILFWFYLTCFGAVYKNTQIHLIKDTLISFGLSLLYPFGINLIPGIFRVPALKSKKKNKKCIYKISKILQII